MLRKYRERTQASLLPCSPFLRQPFLITVLKEGPVVQPDGAPEIAARDCGVESRDVDDGSF
jgi:hypothetical protein